MEERGDGGRRNPSAKRQRGWSGGVNIARLLPNPAWAIVPPPLLDVIKDFSHTTKRAEGMNAFASSPPVGEAMTRRLGAGAGKTQGKLGSMLIQLISQRGWRAVGGRCARRFSARGRRWQRKNWGMPAPVIVLPSSVISKIRRGRREGGSVARTRQRCTPPHAHAAILQAALASRKMAAGAHAASGLQLAHPSGLPSASPEAVGTREQWQPVKGGPGRKGVAMVGQSALASGHLRLGPAHGANALGTRHSHSSSRSPPGWNNLGTLLLHQAARIARALLVATEAAVPSPWFHRWTRAGSSPQRPPPASLCHSEL